MKSRQIEVWADWRELGQPILMGVLRSSTSRGREVFSFSYDRNWLNAGYSRQIDPDLRLFAGPQYHADTARPNFGIFLDSSPDRWGRLLMQRREATLARKVGRSASRLQETNYLLGVHDEQRTGALRFIERAKSDLWQCDEAWMRTPPWASLRELEHASWKIQEDSAGEDPRCIDWLKLLIAPGSSLGGARPKAGVRDADGDLWIAKFPGRSDTRDMAAWEMLAHQLAVESGLQVAEAALHLFGDGHRTFLTRRFDRVPGTGGMERIHFASAMTLLGHADGTDSQAGASYLEIVEFITRQGARPDADLCELWRRIIFSIAIHNTDDHLRNHGFLLTDRGWMLSPAFDLNPDPDGTGLSLNISEDDNALSLDLALEVAPMFRIDRGKADAMIRQVRKVVSKWRRHARDLGIPSAEQDRMASAFGF